MGLEFSATETRNAVFAKIQAYMNDLGLQVSSMDQQRPWGGFFVINELQAPEFAAHFFPGLHTDDLKIGGKLSPKILVVQPTSRLSWQYHYRRAEIWKLVAGEAGIVTSDTDVEGPLRSLSVNEIVRLKQGQRHRLVGLNNWGMVSEIWQHTDQSHPSDENDIVRVTR